jgi:hypothetical protein
MKIKATFRELHISNIRGFRSVSSFTICGIWFCIFAAFILCTHWKCVWFSTKRCTFAVCRAATASETSFIASVSQWRRLCVTLLYRVIQKEVCTYKNLFYKYYWTYDDVLYMDWRENSQSYFHPLQSFDVSPTCDAADAKSIIQLFPHSSKHVTGDSSHSLSDVPLQIIDIGTLRDFLSIRTQDMDLASVVFVK